jgi:hypothetical protein
MKPPFDTFVQSQYLAGIRTPLKPLRPYICKVLEKFGYIDFTSDSICGGEWFDGNNRDLYGVIEEEPYLGRDGVTAIRAYASEDPAITAEIVARALGIWTGSDEPEEVT